MNNDAKDVIGNLRALNVLLIILSSKNVEFPMDTLMGAALESERVALTKMLDLVASLTNFNSERSELLSSIDDILDKQSDDVYTQEYLDMLLSLYAGRTEIVHFHYSEHEVLVEELSTIVLQVTSRLFESIVWVRIAFLCCYPDVAPIPLGEVWREFCQLIASVAGKGAKCEAGVLFSLSRDSWLKSKLVAGLLGEKDKDGMPHRHAFLQAYAEVEAM